MTEASPKPLSVAIGERLRELREARGKRQEEIARAARGAGMGWTRATVAAVELGRRELSLSECLLLPVALSRVGIDAELPDLLPAEGWVALTPETQAHTRFMRALLDGSWRRRPRTELADPPMREAGRKVVSEMLASGPLGRRIEEIWKRLPGRAGRFSPALVAAVIDDARGDAEQKAAWKLRVEPIEVSVAARKLWGAGLTEERERRLGEKGQGLDERSLQALRGHVTRELLTELEPALAVVRRRRSKPTESRSHGEAR